VAVNWNIVRATMLVVFACLLDSAPSNAIAQCQRDIDNTPDPAQYPPVPPVYHADWMFVNTNTGFSQTCIYNTSGPIEFDIDIDRFIGGDVQALITNGLADSIATLYISAFDTDYIDPVYHYCDPLISEYDRVSVNGHVLPDSLLLTITNCEWGVSSLRCPLKYLLFPDDPGNGTPHAKHNHIKIEVDIKNTVTVRSRPS